MALGIAATTSAKPVHLDVPAQPLANALLAFSQQAKVEVLFSSNEVRDAQSSPVHGKHHPEEGLRLLLAGTGFTSRRTPAGKYVVTAVPPAPGLIEGRLTSPDGRALVDPVVFVAALRKRVQADARGAFRMTNVPPGRHQLFATARGYRTFQVHDVDVAAGEHAMLDTIVLEPLLEPARLAPYVVHEYAGDRRPFDRTEPSLAPRTAAGNLDLRRSTDDVLPYTVLERDRIVNSGVIELYHVLQRELLEVTGPDARASSSIFGNGSHNLSLRGYGAEETVVLINGRRLPELLTASADVLPPDVNFIPLSLVQRVEVLPASAAALYSGNAVGGVVNIVLRPDVDVNATEITTTYTNALHDYDAPQSSLSVMHGRSFLDGALRVRWNLNVSQSTPPTEAELGYRRARADPGTPLDEPLHRATPNVRSADGEPLLGPGTSSVTSVPPGTDAGGSLLTFVGREGVRSTGLFDGPGGMSSSINSRDHVYGRRHRRLSVFGSAVYDVNARLQLGFDLIHSRTSLERGYDLLTADLHMDATSPLNPFGQDVLVSLNESAPALGDRYGAARIDFSALVAGAMLRLPRDWRMMADAQYARNTVRSRGLLGADAGRWQKLVDDGRYNPLRDTQSHPPPAAFYDEVLVFRGRRGEFVTLGDYHALDTAIRVIRDDLPVPTGDATVNLGFDYRLTWMEDYIERATYGDGTTASEPQRWRGRTLERVSGFGEVQAPLLPRSLLPTWLRSADVDIAGRYIAADSSNESNFAPTVGLKLGFSNGVSLRASVSTSSRFPNPQMAHPPIRGPVGDGLDLALIQDPRRRNDSYEVAYQELINFDLRAEDATTSSLGLIFERGTRHHIRASLDYFDTRKANESIVIEPQTALYLEPIWPERVRRAPPAPGESVGRVISVSTGRVNAAWRHSQNWNAMLSYENDDVFGGAFDAYARWVYFQRFDLQLMPTEPVVDQLDSPDGSVPGLLRHRVNFGAAWNNRVFGLGFDGRYYHSRVLPQDERRLQRNGQIDPHIQFDVYAHTDVRQWLRWPHGDYGLRAQIRVNNILGPDFPYYWATGVQPYGDWRGRTYSFSLTAVF